MLCIFKNQVTNFHISNRAKQKLKEMKREREKKKTCFIIQNHGNKHQSLLVVVANMSCVTVCKHFLLKVIILRYLLTMSYIDVPLSDLF